MRHNLHTAGILALALLGSCAHAVKRKEFSTEKLQNQITKKNVETLIKDWPVSSQEAVRSTLDKYGLPNGLTPNMITWNGAGHFKRTIVYKDPIPHNFPVEHQDVLQQFVDYEIPTGKADDVLRFSGSIILDKTAGEMSSRCASEDMNILSLNLADRVLRGEISPEQARLEYGRTAMALEEGVYSPLSKSLAFFQSEDSANPDETLQKTKANQQSEEERDLGESDDGVQMELQRIPQQQEYIHIPQGQEVIDMEGDDYEDDSF